MLAADNKSVATGTVYGAYRRLFKPTDRRTYIAASAAMMISSLLWLAALLCFSDVRELLAWLVTLAVTALVYAALTVRELCRPAQICLASSGEGRITQSLSITCLLFSLVLVLFVGRQLRATVLQAPLPRQVVEIELCSRADFSDQKQVLPGTVRLDSLRRRKSSDRISRPGQSAIVAAAIKSGRASRTRTVTTRQEVQRPAIPPRLPVAAAGVSKVDKTERFQPVLPGWKTINLVESRTPPGQKVLKPEAFMQELATPELVELVNNDGDHSMNLWQDGGSSSGGQGKRNQLLEYLKQLNRRIKAVWLPPRGQTRSAEIFFRIDRRGNLVSVNLVRTSGDPQADRAALMAVRSATPFKPLPADYPLAYIDIQYNFNYTVDQLQEINQVSK